MKPESIGVGQSCGAGGTSVAETVEYLFSCSRNVGVMEEKIGVLVIDDEPSVADALKLILDDNGYGAIVARNGRDGLVLACKRRFDIIITDLRLPDMSGLEVLNTIHMQDSHSLIIIITAYGTSEAIRELMSCGAVAVLPKPFFPSDILKTIDLALKNREEQQNQMMNAE